MDVSYGATRLIANHETALAITEFVNEL